MESNSPKAVVIGAGIAGIATAIRLQKKGYNVSVYEANSYAGGKLSEVHGQGYRFDAGPSLFTLPHLVEELFELCGEAPSQYFEYKKLDEVCRYFWDDGTNLTAWAKPQDFAQEVENKLQVNSNIILNFLKKIGKNYDILDKLFLQKSLHKLCTWLGPDAWKGYLNLHDLGIFGTLHQSNKAYFKNQKLVQLFDRYATYNGSDPYQTPATLSIIPHLEYNLGAFFPAKGMYNITKSLLELAERQGVSFYYNTKVAQINHEQQHTTGITLANGAIIPAHIIVSNMDMSATYRKLLPNAIQPTKLINQPKSSSGIVFYWGINRTFAQLDLHNIFFSNDYKAEFNAIFEEKTIYHDPTVYINITSKHKKDDAPHGCENWFVLMNVPANDGQNWEDLVSKMKQNVLKKLSKVLEVNLGDCIDYEQVLDPVGIEIKTSSAQGALYGNSSNNRFAAFLRHPNFSKQFNNLYFVGGSVHPGGGIPLALSSAKICADMIQ